MTGRIVAAFASGFAMPRPPRRRPAHRHPHVEVILNLTGQGTALTGDGQELRFGPGDTTIIPAWQRHDRVYAGAGSALVIRMQIGPPVPAVLRRAWLVHAPLPAWAESEIRSLAGPQDDRDGLARQALDHRCAALLCTLLAAAGPGEAVDPDQALAERADRLIGERFASLGRLEEVAAALGVDYHRLRRIFRRHRGISLMERLTAARLRWAQELLANTPLPHAEIARQCGYSSARYLNRVFRRKAGGAPGRWRR